MPVTSLLVLFGHGLDWIVGPNFSFVMGWVRRLVGLGWVKKGPTDNSAVCNVELQFFCFYYQVATTTANCFCHLVFANFLGSRL